MVTILAENVGHGPGAPQVLLSLCLHSLSAGVEPGEGALGLDRSRRYAVDPDTIPAPLGRQCSAWGRVTAT